MTELSLVAEVLLYLVTTE